MKKNSVTMMVFETIALLAFSCKKGTIASAAITLNPSSLMSFVGGRDTLKTTLSPSNASDGIAWNSSNPAIAGVNQSGVVTGVAAGIAVTNGNNR